MLERKPSRYSTNHPAITGITVWDSGYPLRWVAFFSLQAFTPFDHTLKPMDEPSGRGPVDDIVIETHCQTEEFPLFDPTTDQLQPFYNTSDRNIQCMGRNRKTPSRTVPEHADRSDHYGTEFVFQTSRHPSHQTKQ